MSDEENSDTAADPTTVEHRWDGDCSPSVAVVKATAAATDRAPERLPPLQRTVDADAINDLFTGSVADSLRLSFEYADATVTLRGDGSIELSTR